MSMITVEEINSGVGVEPRDASCEQHSLPIGPSGICPECEFESTAYRCGEHGLILNPDGLCQQCEAEFGTRLREFEATEAPQTPLSVLAFPPQAMVGSIGDLARLLAKRTEVPEEFYFAASLTMFGAMCAGDLTLNLAFNVDPRLYTVLLGESYAVKKSTAMKKTVGFFETLKPRPSVQYGVASAEGLARILKNSPNLVLAYDELQMFIQKSQVTASTLLPVVTSLYEQNNWDNATKSAKYSVKIEGAYLSLLGCCTSDTYARMWNPQAIAIGFLNRLFIVNADRRVKVAWPVPPSQTDLQAIRERIQRQLERLPKQYEITAAGKIAWERWYNNVPPTEHARRLDTIGFRLLGLIALTTDKDAIDEEVVRIVTAILDYELNIRTLTDPIDADSIIAKLEEGIRRQLAKRGDLNERKLRQFTGADKKGLWAFNQAMANLKAAHDIEKVGDKFRLTVPPEV
jgi:hypothetical protein